VSGRFELVRVAIDEAGAFGVLNDNGHPFAVTLERTFGDKVVIPPGEYVCKRTRYHKADYDTFEIPVPGHTRVLFHVGNIEDDSEGCILIGLQFGLVQGKPGVHLSRLGFHQFMKRIGNRSQISLRVFEGKL
jgi:hypothetical protein